MQIKYYNNKPINIYLDPFGFSIAYIALDGDERIDITKDEFQNIIEGEIQRYKNLKESYTEYIENLTKETPSKLADEFPILTYVNKIKRLKELLSKLENDSIWQNLERRTLNHDKI